MRSGKKTYVPVMSFALVGALSMGMLAGCGGKAEETATTATEENVTAEKSASDDSTASAGEGTAQDAGATATAQNAGVIDAGAFTFQLPAQWEGKVEVSLGGAANGQPSATVTLPGNSEATLATLTYYSDGADVMAAGDVASHLAGSVSGDGTRVEVWTKNWPWFAATGATPSSVSEEELRTLVELSTGGAVSYDDVVGTGEAAVGTQEPDFAKAELVSTVVIK